MKAFLLAAGFGTRLRPLTDIQPKALIKVNGKSLLERNIKNLQRFGIFDVVINVHHFAEQIIAFVQKSQGFGSRIAISDETNRILETGGGIKNAIPLLKGKDPVLVMNVDILSNFNLEKMLTKHCQSKALVTLAVQNRQSSRMLLFDKSDNLLGWQNTKTHEIRPSRLRVGDLQPYAFSGIQILSQGFFGKIVQEGKFSIIETYLSLCANEKIMAWNHSGDLWLDVGSPEKLYRAEKMIKD